MRKKRVIRLLFPFPLCEVLCRVLFCPIMLDIFLNNAILVYEANNEKKESTHPQSLYNECAGYVMNAVFVCCLRRNSNWFSAYILNSRSFGIQLFSLENAWFSFFCAFRAVCERIFFHTSYYTTALLKKDELLHRWCYKKKRTISSSRNGKSRRKIYRKLSTLSWRVFHRNELKIVHVLEILFI